MWKKRNRCNSSVSDHKKTVTLQTLGTQGFTKSVTVVTVVTEKNRYTLPGEIFFSGMKMERTRKKAEYKELLLFQAKICYTCYIIDYKRVLLAIFTPRSNAHPIKRLLLGIFRSGK